MRDKWSHSTWFRALPVVYWLPAVAGSVVPLVITDYALGITDYASVIGYFVPALLALWGLAIITHIPRHTSSVESCFQVGLLLGIAAHWLPSIVLLAVPMWLYLMYRNIFSFQSLLATLIGLIVVVIWMCVLGLFTPLITLPSPTLWWKQGLICWLPTGTFLAAYIATAVTRRRLRER